MPTATDMELCIGIGYVLRTGDAIWMRSSILANCCKSIHVILCLQRIDEIACPPIAGVPSRNEVLVVLHELSIANDNLAIVPNRANI